MCNFEKTFEGKPLPFSFFSINAPFLIKKAVGSSVNWYALDIYWYHSKLEKSPFFSPPPFKNNTYLKRPFRQKLKSIEGVFWPFFKMLITFPSLLVPSQSTSSFIFPNGVLKAKCCCMLVTQPFLQY